MAWLAMAYHGVMQQKAHHIQQLQVSQHRSSWQQQLAALWQGVQLLVIIYQHGLADSYAEL